MWICVALLLVIPGLLFVTSCAKKVVKVDTTQEDEAAKLAAEKARQEEIARQSAIDEKRRIEDEKRRIEEAAGREIIAARNLFMNENIYFDFDKSNLKSEAQEVLKKS